MTGSCVEVSRSWDRETSVVVGPGTVGTVSALDISRRRWGERRATLPQVLLDAARRAQQEAGGEEAATLSLAGLAALAHALTIDLPVLTGDRRWATLAHGLTVDVHPATGQRPDHTGFLPRPV